MTSDWTLHVPDPEDLAVDTAPADRWCSLGGPRGPCHPSIEGTADEWLAVADAIAGFFKNGWCTIAVYDADWSDCKSLSYDHGALEETLVFEPMPVAAEGGAGS